MKWEVKLWNLKLNKIYLSYNKITDITVLRKIDSNFIAKINLKNNNIDTNKNASLIEKLRLSGNIWIKNN